MIQVRFDGCVLSRRPCADTPVPMTYIVACRTDGINRCLDATRSQTRGRPGGVKAYRRSRWSGWCWTGRSRQAESCGGRDRDRLHRARRDGRADLRQPPAKVGLPHARFRSARGAARAPRRAGLETTRSAEDAARDASLVFLSLPGGPELAAVGERLLAVMQAGAVLVDLSTGRWI